jgi:hypothetical protein
VSEATDQEMRSAVEWWARARGWLPIVGEFDLGKAPWSVKPWSEAGTTVQVQRLGCGGAYGDELDVSPHAALVWALVLEARPLRDGSRCRRCRGRGTWDEWWRVTWGRGGASPEDADAVVNAWRRDGWRVAGGLLGETYDHRQSRTIPCPDCEGTGLADLTDAYAQHVLDAQPRPNATGIRFITSADTNGVVVSCRVDGANEASIEALHVLADRLQAAADPLGFDIAHLLAGSHEGTASAVERLDAAANLLHKLRWDAARSSGAGTWP